MMAQDKARTKSDKKMDHTTSEEMVKDLLSYLNILESDVVMDAGSGKNKVWYNNVKSNNKLEMEIDDGKDYLQFNGEVDWTIGNPPYHISWDFHYKALQTSRKGIAWLVNLNNLNSLLSSKRLNIAKSYGFYLTKMIVVEDRRWFGRYFFLVFTKNGNPIIEWIDKNMVTKNESIQS